MNRISLLLTFLLSSLLVSAQTPCPQPQSFILNATDTLACPGELDTLTLSNSSSSDDHYWYKLVTSEWGNINLNGSTSPIDIESSNNDTVFGLFSGLGVYKLDVNTWVSVTSNLPSNETPLRLAIGDTNSIYVATENSSSLRASVWKWNGTAWSVVGSQNITTTNPEYLDLEVDNSDRPVIAYANDSINDFVTVRRFNGTSWNTLGPVNANSVEPTYIDLEISSTNGVYFAIIPWLNSLGVRVYNYSSSSSSWSSMGTSAVTNFSTSDLDFELLGSTPYVATRSFSSGNKIFVSRLSGSSWQQIAPFNGSEFGSMPELEVAKGSLIFSYTSSGRKFLKRVGSSWQDYMVTKTSSGSTSKMKIGYRGFPVLVEGGNTQTYLGVPFNTNTSQTQQIIDTAGVYLAVRTNSCGNYSRDQEEVESHPVPNYSFSQINNLCHGDSNGSITITPIGSEPILSYLWSNGETSNTTDSLVVGTYQVTLTGNYCTIYDTVTLNDPAPLSSTFVSENSDCLSDDNGKIIPTPIGGTPPLLFTINGIVSNYDTLDFIPVGSHEVITLDKHHCQTSDIVSVGSHTTIPSAVINQDLDQTYCLDSILLTTTSGSYTSDEWAYFTKRDFQFQEFVTGGNLPNHSKLFVARNGDILVGGNSTSSPRIVRRVNATWVDEPLPSSFPSNSFPFTFNYVDGWMLLARRAGSNGYGFYRKFETDSTWDALDPIYFFGTGTPSQVEMTQLDGTFYGLFYFAGGQSRIYSYDERTDDWQFVDNFSNSHEDLKILKGQDGKIYIAGKHVASNDIIIKSYDGTTWDTISNGAQTAINDAYDIVLRNNTLTIAYREFNPSRVVVESWNGSSWDVIGNLSSPPPYSYSPVYLRDFGDNLTVVYKSTSSVAQVYSYIANNWVHQNDSLELLSGSLMMDVSDDGTIHFIQRSYSTGVPDDYYKWEPQIISTSDSVYANQSGIYRYKGIEGSCNELLDFHFIAKTPNFDLSVLQEVSCIGDNNGIASILIDSNLGISPYTFQWSNGSSLDTISNLAGGVYTVTLTDNDNCQVEDSINVFEPSAFALDSISTNAPTCFGSNDGEVSVYISGGRTPYLFEWDTITQTSVNTTGLTSGNHSVFVSDSGNCFSDTLQFTVPVSSIDVLKPTISPTYTNLCGVDSINITANSNGSAYQWYDLEQGSWQLAGGTDFRDPNFLTDVTDLEINEYNHAFVAIGGYYHLPDSGISEVHMYNGFDWYTYPKPFASPRADVRNIDLALDKNSVPYIAFSTGDSVEVKKWNGTDWMSIYTEQSNVIYDVRLEYNEFSDQFLLAFELGGVTGAQIRIIENDVVTTPSYSPIGNEIYFRSDISASKTSSDFFIAASNNSNSGSILYKVSSNAATALPGIPNGILYHIEIDGSNNLYLSSNGGVFKGDGVNAWSQVGPYRNSPAIRVNDHGNIYYTSTSSWSSGTFIFNGNNWQKIVNESFSGVRDLDMAFTSSGLPVRVRVNHQFHVLELFEATQIQGATSSTFTAKSNGRFLVEVSNGVCSKSELVSVDSIYVDLVSNAMIQCPGDSGQIKINPSGFESNYQLMWSNGDTNSILDSIPAGNYSVTISDSYCTITDTFNLPENFITASIDSIAQVSCPNGKDGFVELSISTLNNYSLSWSDGTLGYNPRYNLEPGNYDFIATIQGCNAGDTVSFAITEPQGFSTAINTSATQISLCENDSIQLQAQIDSTASIQWMSYDSLEWGVIRLNDFTDRSNAAIEKDGKLYAMKSDPNGYAALYQLVGDRWMHQWSDTISYSGHSRTNMVLDSLGNFLIPSVSNAPNQPGKVRVLRFGSDTTVLFEASASSSPLTKLRNPKLVFYNNELVLVTETYTTDFDQARLLVQKWNGSNLVTISGHQNDIIGLSSYGIDVEADGFGNLWVGYLSWNGFSSWSETEKLLKYDGTNWTQVFSLSNSLSTSKRALHTLPDGSLWALIPTDYGNELFIGKYSASGWDTITDWHVNMSSSFNSYELDISHSPEGLPLIQKNNRTFELRDTGWVQLGDVLGPMNHPSFVERSCKYPEVLAGDYTYQARPATLVGTGNSVTISSKGIYQPIAENGGCYNYDACASFVSEGYNVTIANTQQLACVGDSNAVLEAIVSGDASGTLSYNWSNGATTNSIDSLTAGTYYLTVTDASGCASSDSIVLVDPTSIEFQSVTVVNNDCGGNPTGAIQLSATGGSGTLSILWSSGETTFNISNLVDTTYVATVSDTNGCQRDSVIVITPQDTSAPTLNAQDITTYIGANGEAVIQWMDVDPNITDNCGIQSIVLSTDTFNCSLIGQHQTTILVVDSSGNQSLDTFNVTVLDSTRPQLLTSTFNIFLDNNGMATLDVSSVDSASTDNCGIDSMYISQEQFTCSDLGSNSIWFYAKDESSNLDSTQVLFDVLDTIHPTITPSFLVTYLDSLGAATIDTNQVLPLADDNCTTDSLWWTPSSFSCSPGIDSTTIYARDLSGNISSLTIPVDVIDTISPAIQTFQQVQVTLDVNGMFVITPALLDSATIDNCGIDTMYTSIDSVSCADVGTIAVVLFAQDSAGNMSQKPVQVTITDQVAPTILTQNQTIYLDANGQAGIIASQLDNGTWDSCGVQSLAINQSSFDCNDLGSNNIWFYATDVHGNIDSVQVSIQVLDTTQPIAVVQSTDTLYLNSNGTANLTPSQLDLGSSDNCSGLSFNANRTSFNCSDVGSNAITLNISDVGGNSVNEPVSIVVLDTISPTITCPAGETICEGSYTFNDPIANDNCAATLNQSSGPNSGDVLSAGVYTIEFEAVDNSSNTATCSFEVEVLPVVAIDLGADTTISLGQSITLNGGPASWSYLWSTGENTASISLSPTSDTLIWVEATNSYCDDSDTINIAVALSNKDSRLAANGLQIYPNPTLGDLWIKFNAPTQTPISIMVRTMDGRMVRHYEEGATDLLNLDLNQLAQGVYWIEVKADGEIIRKGISVK